MTNIVKFFVVKYGRKVKTEEKRMTFEEYAGELRAKREAQRMERLNGALARGVQTRSHDEAVRALYAGLTFVGGISDFVKEKAVCKGKELVF